MTIIAEASNMLNNVNVIFDEVSKQSQKIISNFNFDKFKVPDEIQKILGNSTDDFLITISNWVKGFLTKVLNILTSLPTVGLYIIVTLLALYFICTDKIYMLDQIEHHFPEIWVKKISQHLKDLIKSLGCYLKAQAILILISFIISLIGLYIFKLVGLDVPYPLIAAIGIGFVDALPIFGSGTVMVPWSIIAAFKGNMNLAISIFILWIVMSIVRQFIEPKIVSRSNRNTSYFYISSNVYWI